jgi:hypothetical protein
MFRTLVVVLIALTPDASYAQASGNGPRFDVASIEAGRRGVSRGFVPYTFGTG